MADEQFVKNLSNLSDAPVALKFEIDALGVISNVDVVLANRTDSFLDISNSE